MPQTCLIAAHDPWFIQLLRVYSEESGFRVVQAYEGQDVLPLVLQEKPATVLLQIDLPGQVKGREVLRLLKRDPTASRIPVLAFSWQDQADASDIEDIVTAHLQEPVTYKAFVEALAKAGVQCHERTKALDEKTLPEKVTAPDAPKAAGRLKHKRE